MRGHAGMSTLDDSARLWQLNAGPLRESVALFLTLEAQLLDACRWREWQALFDAGGDYWMPLSPEQPDPVDHVSLLYETRAGMELRLRRLEGRTAVSQQPPSRTVHAVGNVLLRGIDEATGTLEASAVFSVSESRAGETRRFEGHYRYHLRRDVGTPPFRILRKTVVLVDCDAALPDILCYL